MSLIEINDFKIFEEEKYYRILTNEEEFNYSDGAEEEKYIFNCIANAEDRTSFSDELKFKIRDWSSKYHLSKERANIIRAVEFKNKNNMKVLEIGGGCGAITRYLGEEFREVDSIEGSQYRSKIITERCKDLDNVNVYCANLFDISLPENYYDLVIMIGVLEYSNVYSQIDNNPIKSAQIVLESLNSSLKSNGQIILAIENKFGLKYFSGASEDHTGIQFDSIMGYTKSNTPVTYGKETLGKILSKAGFKNQNWFYPYPDYKLPSVFISDLAAKDTSLFVDNWIETPFTDSGKNYKTIFNEALAVREIYREGMLPQFANSFLILAGKNETISNQNWLIKKLNSHRFNDYCTEIKLISNNEQLLIKRKLLFSKGAEKKIENPQYLHNICDESYIKGELLTGQLTSYLLKNEIFTGLLEYSIKLKNYLEENFSTEKFDDKGYLVLLPNSIDKIFKNIIVSENNEWASFDNEWEAKNDNITIDYILYRAIVYYLNSYLLNFFDNSGEKLKQMVYNLLEKLFKNFNEERYNELLSKEEQFQILVNKGELTNSWNNFYNEESQRVDKLIYETEELIQKEKYEDAKKILLSILNNDDSNLDVQNNLAVIAIIEEKYPDAIEIILNILQRDPNDEIALSNLKFLQTIISKNNVEIEPQLNLKLSATSPDI